MKLLILNDSFLDLTAVKIFFNETTFAYHIFYAFKRWRLIKICTTLFLFLYSFLSLV